MIVSPSHFFAEKKFQFIPQETPVITLQHRLYIYNYTVKYVLGKICNICYVFFVSYKCTNGIALWPTAGNGLQRVFRTRFERGNVFKICEVVSQRNIIYHKTLCSSRSRSARKSKISESAPRLVGLPPGMGWIFRGYFKVWIHWLPDPDSKMTGLRVRFLVWLRSLFDF